MTPSLAHMPLKGRHAVITGGGKGIGAAIAARLAAEGACITLMGRDAERLAATARDLDNAQAVTLDVTDEAAVDRAFAGAVEGMGPVSILVNNAGAVQSMPFRKMDSAHWRAMLQVNLTGAFYCAKAVVGSMEQAGWGRIVSIASTAGLKGYAYVAAYCAAKHGLIGLTRALALELAQKKITVNAVCPGYTDTDIVAHSVETLIKKTGRSPAQALDDLTAANPQGRLVHPEEVAATVAWLCSPESAAITGQSIAVAGGEVM